MTFGLTHAPAIYQASFNNCFPSFIDNFAVCSMDAIVIYSTNEEEHEEQVGTVFKWLRDIGLYA